MINKFDYNNIKNRIKEFKNRNTDHWLRLQEKSALNLFKKASKYCRAYRDFLKKHRINPEKIKTIQDFHCLPPTNKENYIHQYPFDLLLWDKALKKPKTIHATSGSTGEPTYFTRDIENDKRRAFIFELFLNQNKESLRKPTLLIITFGMGIWSAGMGIFIASYITNNKNKLPISIITPGVNLEEVLKIIKNLSGYYQQIIIAGYPPFVKDIIDNIQNIVPKKLNFRFIFTGEGFPEEFRNYLYENIKINNIYTDTMNTYGTSEFGATSIETPISILIRRLVYQNKQILFDLFNESSKIPTLVQNPYSNLYIYSQNQELFITANNIMPLINYQINDFGGTISYERINEILQDHKINLEKYGEEAGIRDYYYKLPFVYIFERKNFAVTLYGILIYPEFIKPALLEKSLSQFLTGKFIMTTKYDKLKNQYLEIIVELKKGINKLNPKQIDLIKKAIVQNLIKRSSEYRELLNNRGQQVEPVVHYALYEEKGLFDIKSKHKWRR